MGDKTWGELKEVVAMFEATLREQPFRWLFLPIF